MHLNFDETKSDEVSAVEKLLPDVDQLLKARGWEYTGFRNMYRPVPGTDPDDTHYFAEKAIVKAEWFSRTIHSKLIYGENFERLGPLE